MWNVCRSYGIADAWLAGWRRGTGRHLKVGDAVLQGGQGRQRRGLGHPPCVACPLMVTGRPRKGPRRSFRWRVRLGEEVPPFPACTRPDGHVTSPAADAQLTHLAAATRSSLQQLAGSGHPLGPAPTAGMPLADLHGTAAQIDPFCMSELMGHRGSGSHTDRRVGGRLSRALCLVGRTAVPVTAQADSRPRCMFIHRRA